MHLVPRPHVERLGRIIDTAWDIFTSQFLGGRHNVGTEAAFQHHFADVISEVGSLFCTSRDDAFLVDLETRTVGPGGRWKYLDITCSFPNTQVSAALELKFKTRHQAAEDHGRIDVYSALRALEVACEQGYSFGRFYMITNNYAYIRPSRRGVGTQFATHHGHICTPGLTLIAPSLGHEGVHVTLSAPYEFSWSEAGGWSFLQLHVQPGNTQREDEPPL